MTRSTWGIYWKTNAWTHVEGKRLKMYLAPKKLRINIIFLKNFYSVSRKSLQEIFLFFLGHSSDFHLRNSLNDEGAKINSAVGDWCCHIRLIEIKYLPQSWALFHGLESRATPRGRRWEAGFLCWFPTVDAVPAAASGSHHHSSPSRPTGPPTVT